MEVILALLALLVGFFAWRKAQEALTEVQALRALLVAREAGAPLPPPLPVEMEPGPAPEAAVEPPFAPEPPPIPPPLPQPAPPAMDIERLLTQRWGIWLGGFAILLAGVFLIRTAAERGWMGPGARCLEGLALGLALVAGAFWLRRRPAPAMPFADYGPSALAAGGVATLFAAAYGAGPLYGLVPAPIGFALMAAAAAAGLALSLLFGQLVAALGLLAAFATPALVQTKDPSLPGLFAYLFIVSAACWAVVRTTAWTWLGWGTALGGAIWVALAAGALAVQAPAAQAWAPGLFVPAAVALTLALLPEAAVAHPIGRRFAWAPLLMLGLAGLALAAATQDGAARTGVLLLAPIAMAKAWREPRLAWLPMVTAGLSVLVLLAWILPAVQPTAEEITIEGVVQAILPGPFAPEAIIPFLQVAAAVALLHALAGLWGERRTPNPLPWAALTAGGPVLVLAAAYLRVGRFQPQSAWAVVAGLLAAALVGAAALARRESSIQRAGVHAAGAVASLALGCAILLDTAWLTVALALMLPALAWIEAAAGLPALRRVALVVASVVLVRLVLNPALVSYPVGATPVFNVLLIAYGIPAACFSLAARLFGPRRDRLVDVLTIGACLFGGLLLLLEVRQWQHGGAMWTADPGFGEMAWMVSVLGAYAVALQELAARRPSPVLRAARWLAGGLSLAGGAVLLVLNPFLLGMEREQGVFANDLLPAYLLPAILALAALARGARPQKLLGGYALLALLMWSSATVRQAFHPGATAVWQADVEDAELWALSGAWTLLAACTLAAGIALRQRALRLAGLALVVLVVAKVFLVDMSGLEGLWRVLSFLGLGLGLIGLGAAYRRFGARL